MNLDLKMLIKKNADVKFKAKSVIDRTSKVE